jgi:hypothetical protein
VTTGRAVVATLAGTLCVAAADETSSANVVDAGATDGAAVEAPPYGFGGAAWTVVAGAGGADDPTEAADVATDGGAVEKLAGGPAVGVGTAELVTTTGAGVETGPAVDTTTTAGDDWMT